MTQQPIGNNVPLRLADALALAFPAGGMTVAGLRRERDKGNLAVMRIAGKEFVTLAAIDAMLEACTCRTAPKAPSSTAVYGRERRRPFASGPAPASSAQAALMATLNNLSESLDATSGESAGRTDVEPPNPSDHVDGSIALAAAKATGRALKEGLAAVTPKHPKRNAARGAGSPPEHSGQSIAQMSARATVRELREQLKR